MDIEVKNFNTRRELDKYVKDNGIAGRDVVVGTKEELLAKQLDETKTVYNLQVKIK